MTAQIALLLTGVLDLATPLVIPELIHHGFLSELGIAFAITTLAALCCIGYLNKGLYRYLASIVTIGLVLSLGLFLLGYGIFGWLYLNELQPLSGLMDLVWQRHQENKLWLDFLKTEGGLFLVGLIALSLFLFNRFRPEKKVLGNAHFANGIEVNKASFFKHEEQSIIIGKKYGAPLYSNGFEHVLVFAPTGSGKTRSIGIPNLFNYPYSVVCNDVKLTLFQATSGFRHQILGQQCYCWAPAHEHDSLMLIILCR